MPSYLHLCENCQHEWEDFYSINADPPDTCPQCQTLGKVKRLIYGGSGRGKVELSGQELIDKMNAETEAMRKEIYNNEKALANFVGEGKYQINESRRDAIKRDLKGRPIIRSRR